MYFYYRSNNVNKLIVAADSVCKIAKDSQFIGIPKRVNIFIKIFEIAQFLALYSIVYRIFCIFGGIFMCPHNIHMLHALL